MSRYKGIVCIKCNREYPYCICKPLNVVWKGYPIQLQRQWYKEYKENHKTSTRFNKETIKEASALHRKGYIQLSRRYMTVGVFGTLSIELTKEVFACFKRMERTINHYRGFHG